MKKEKSKTTSPYGYSSSLRLLPIVIGTGNEEEKGLWFFLSHHFN